MSAGGPVESAEVKLHEGMEQRCW